MVRTVKSRDAGERRHESSRGIALWPYIRGATGAEVPLYKSIIGYFMVNQDRLETALLQLFAHPDTSERFSVISVMNFDVNSVAEQKQALLVTIFKFPLSSTLTDHLTYRCSGVPGKEGKIVRCGSLLCPWCRCESRTIAGKSSIGGLYVCAGEGGLDIKTWQKFHWFVVFHTSIWGGLELCLGV